MPQFQMLDPNPGFGSQLGRALGQGFSAGISKGIDNFYKQKEDNRKREEYREKAKQAVDKNLPGFLKNYGEEFEDDYKSTSAIRKKVHELIDQDIPPTQAYDLALADYRKGLESSPGSQKKPTFSHLEGVTEAPLDISPQQKNLIERLTEPASPEGSPGLLGQAVREKIDMPTILGSLALGLPAALEEMNIMQGFPGVQRLAENTGLFEKTERPPLITEKLREKLHEDLSPEQQKAAESIEFAGSLIPVSSLISGISRIGKGAPFINSIKRIGRAKNISTPQVLQDIAKEAESVGVDLGKVASGEKKEAQRFFKIVDKESSPTTSRTERVEKGMPKFQPESEASLRETQLREHPKYEKEISKDAQERAERLESQKPKTEKGEIGLQKRRAQAQSQLPEIRDNYQRAIARNRALEDSYVNASGEARAKISPLLQHSRKNLKEAEDAYKQTLSNSKHGTSKKGIADQKKSAQEKTLKLSDDIAEGKQIKLGKADYNPETIREAERIKKLKKQPSGHPPDKFYEDVHNTYEDVYKDHLSKLNKEISELKGNIRSLSDAQKMRTLQKEKDIFEKMIKQTEAEKIIHRRKLRLREMAERKRAQERLKNLKPARDSKTERYMGSRREKIKKFEEDFKNPEKNSEKIFEEAAEQAKKEKPKLEEQIKESKQQFKEEAKKGKKAGSDLGEDLDSLKKEKSAKEAAKKGMHYIKKFQVWSDRLLKKIPWLGQTEIGRDVLKGMIQAALEEASRVVNLGISPGVVMSLGFGRPRGAFLRLATHQFIKNKIIPWWKEERIAQAYRDRDQKKISEYKKKYSSSMMKKGRQRAFNP